MCTGKWPAKGIIHCKNQCWAVLRSRDRYLTVIIPGIYPLNCQFSKSSKNWHWYITAVLKNNKKKSKNLPKNHHWFFAGSQLYLFNSI